MADDVDPSSSDASGSSDNSFEIAATPDSGNNNHYHDSNLAQFTDNWGHAYVEKRNHNATLSKR